MVIWVLVALGVGLLLGFWIGFQCGMKAVIYRLLDSLPHDKAVQITKWVNELKDEMKEEGEK